MSIANLYSIKLLRTYLASSYKPKWIIQPWRPNISQRQVKSGKDLQHLSTTSNASSCVPGSAMTTPSIVHLELNHVECCKLLVLHRWNKLLNKFLEMSIRGCSRPIGSEIQMVQMEDEPLFFRTWDLKHAKAETMYLNLTGFIMSAQESFPILCFRPRWVCVFWQWNKLFCLSIKNRIKCQCRCTWGWVGY